jgi:hypothetical protein
VKCEAKPRIARPWGELEGELRAELATLACGAVVEAGTDDRRDHVREVDPSPSESEFRTAAALNLKGSEHRQCRPGASENRGDDVEHVRHPLLMVDAIELTLQHERSIGRLRVSDARRGRLRMQRCGEEERERENHHRECELHRGRVAERAPPHKRLAVVCARASCGDGLPPYT